MKPFSIVSLTIVSLAATAFTAEAGSYSKYSNRDITPGVHYAASLASSLASCMRSCSSDSRCKAFVYVSRRGNTSVSECYLKESTSRQTPPAGVTCDAYVKQ